MYDWANSAFQTTIVAAVFPIYFHKVAAAGSAAGGGDQPVRLGDDDRHPDRRGDRAAARRHRRLRGDEEEAARRSSWRSASVATGAMYWIERGDWLLALVLFVIGNVGVAGSIVFYESLLPHLVRARRAGSRLVGGLRGRLPRRRRAAGDQHPDDPEAGAVRPARRRRSATRELSMASVAVWWVVFSIPLFREVPEPPRRIEAGERPSGNALVTGAEAAGRDLPRAARATGRRSVPAGVPALQRRHPDDHPDGDDLRHRDRASTTTR